MQEFPSRGRTVQFGAGRAVLEGELAAPEEARGLVDFAHGSGSSRHSPRNQFVAGVLNRAGFATLLFDLLTESEEATDRITAQLRFNIPLLAERMSRATEWVERQPLVEDLPVGYFGASTGAAAALVAAARRNDIAAVVSRGGRPDLAGEALPHVNAPTLLIVGSRDTYVIELNRIAQGQMTAENELRIIGGASHLFEEPGTLEQAAEATAEWFGRYLGAESRRRRAA